MKISKSQREKSVNIVNSVTSFFKTIDCYLVKSFFLVTKNYNSLQNKCLHLFSDRNFVSVCNLL